MKNTVNKPRAIQAVFMSCVILCGMMAPCLTASAIAPDPTYYTTRQGNPYLPLWEYIPDGEPYVYEDPDNPGQYRVYIYGSHDMMKTGYCGWDLVTWSAPVDDLTNWRYDGVIFESNVTGSPDVLYAPDTAEVVDKVTGKKTYYLYPNNMNGARNGQVAKSDRPDGPFETINWHPTIPNQTQAGAPEYRFDPAVLVDDDGRVYEYWGGGSSYYAELMPDMYTIKPGTQVNNPFPNNNQSGDWRFNEGSSIRKVGDTYVFVYARGGASSEPTGSSSNAQLAYGWSKNPLGPYTYGGIIVDCAGETIPNESGSGYGRTFNSGNTHGGICEINGQWYVFFHRSLHSYARQAMVEPINLTLNDDGSVVITAVEGSTPALGTAVEVTSNGFYLGGLDPYRKHSAGIASYIGTTARPTLRPAYDKNYEGISIYNIRNNSTVGIKYFNFDSTVPQGKHTKLELGLQPLGVDAEIEVFLRAPEDANTTSLGESLGTISLTADMPQVYTTLSIPTPRVNEVDGKYGVFLKFSGASSDSDNICELHDLQFVIEDNYLEDDFENGLAYWTTSKGEDAIITAEDGALTMVGTGAQTIGKLGKKWSDYSFESNINDFAGTLNVRFRQSGARDYYELAITNKQLELSSTVYGVKSVIQTADHSIGNGPFKLTVDAVKDLITVRVNGALLMTARDKNHEIGTVGFVTGKDSMVSVDSVLVGKSSYTPPPATSIARVDGITLNGAPLPGFAADIYSYTVGWDLADGIPVVGASSTGDGVKVSVSQVGEIPGTAIVRFVDSEETQTYSIRLYNKDVDAPPLTGLTKLPEGWEYAHTSETAKSKVTFEDTGIQLYCDATGDFPIAPATKNWPAIQRTEPLQGDWMFDVKFRADKVMSNSGFGANGGYQQYGLAMQSGTTAVKFVMMNNGNNQVAHVANVGSASVTKNGTTTNYMRWVKMGNVLSSYHSADGVNFSLIAQGTLNPSFFETARFQIGATLNSGSASRPYTVWVESLVYTNLGESTEMPAEQQAVEDAAAIIGTSLLIPKGDYADAEAKAAKAVEVILAMDEIKELGVACTVVPSGSGYTASFKKGTAVMQIERLTIVVFSADWAALSELIDEAESLSEIHYTLASWNKLQNVLRDALELDESSGDLATTNAYDRLKTALDAMEEVVDDGGIISVEGVNNGGYTNAEAVNIKIDDVGLEMQSLTVFKDGKVVTVLEGDANPKLDLTSDEFGDGVYQLVADLGEKYTFKFISDRTPPVIDFDPATSRVTVTDANLETVLLNGVETTDSFVLSEKGTYTVTATDKAGNETIAELAGRIEVVSVKINSAATSTVRKNKTLQLAPVFTPLDANYGTEVTWTSSNTASVKVDAETGLVTGIKAGGSARVTATTSNGKTYTITVTVDS